MNKVARGLVGICALLLCATASLACTLPPMQTDQRPNAQAGPTDVTVAFIVADFLGVDDVNQQLDLDLIAHLKWVDPRLIGQEGCRFNVTEVWFPPIVLFNSSHLRTARTNARNQVAVGENGEVQYTQRFTGLISSYHNLRDFPFDDQMFEIEFGSLRYGPEDLNLIADDEKTWMSERRNIEGWNMNGLSLSAANQRIEQFDRNVSVLNLTIDASRDQDYYIYRVILLLVFVVAMSWIIFWIPPSRFEFQIGLGGTSMLTIIAFYLAVSSNLPQLGYLTVLDKILAVSIGLVFLSIVEALLAGLLVQNDREKLALSIDRVSRVLFPVALFGSWLFLIYY